MRTNITIDKNFRIGGNINLLDQNQPTLIYNFSRESKVHNLEYETIDEFIYEHGSTFTNVNSLHRFQSLEDRKSVV